MDPGAAQDGAVGSGHDGQLSLEPEGGEVDVARRNGRRSRLAARGRDTDHGDLGGLGRRGNDHGERAARLHVHPDDRLRVVLRKDLGTLPEGPPRGHPLKAPPLVVPRLHDIPGPALGTGTTDDRVHRLLKDKPHVVPLILENEPHSRTTGHSLRVAHDEPS
ncbi:hypothetical protein SVEN_3072 [Streptomyces venezuelae ATCC 10712]|uniref:Uncharacterized protein n=1 Tax=Streptomyces venezuelae (strain ATCC 10712 / CBS 650.69 / DSM 40230 / JCM 4526 / NBRC 13096 / PD 04745) TaxID=953739 RepID=F2R7S3_STRVP|nr:hypothetical protein SVEN_3072 [Streptomyces venezuelae ATCC 10712]